MRSLILYPYPMQLDGVSIQGELLYRGLLENKLEAVPCDRGADMEKEWLYKSYKPDVSIGIGYWGDVPELVQHPQEYGVKAVPWLNADGWVSNYHETLNSLPLIMTTSQWVKEIYHRDGVTNKNIHPMPIGIDTNEMKPLPKDHPSVKTVREMFGVEDDEKMILTMGGDTTSKGSQEILKALATVDKEFKKWKYIGKSWYCPEYHKKDEEKIIKDYNLPEEKIELIEAPMSRNFMNALINACDIYAAPSRIEGFGMIQVEAQSCGKPVVSIDAMGIKDTVVQGKTGYLAKVGEEIKLEEEWVYENQGFPKKMQIKFDKPKTFAVRADIDELAKYLLKLLTDDSLREKMGQAGREHAVKNFHYTKIAKDVSDLIKKKLDIE